MADHTSKADFNAMIVAELKKHLDEQGIPASVYLKTPLCSLPVDPNFEKTTPLLQTN